ncbi:hypothetical protein AB0F42_26095 [Streptomyces buecherae]|uniref:hypothetical protein n=1 Tax=Streptomyces buecherae TaxID=2763006 RepID=UPI0033CD47E5
MATWKNVKVTFDNVDTPKTTVRMANYLRVSPNTEEGPIANNIEVGLYADKTGKGKQTYGPRWSELSLTGGGTTKAITTGVNPTKADNRNHTYMAVRQSKGDQWDVLYDFNRVGTTKKQLKVPRGNPNRIDIGLEVMGPQYVDVPNIGNRMQFMREDKVWQRAASADTAKVNTLGGCGAKVKPPYCFNAKLTGGESFTQWSVSKPRKAPKVAESIPVHAERNPAIAPEDAHDVFNGVDQQALEQCMKKDPDNCLTTVPGLAECVQSVGVCNAGGLLETLAFPSTKKATVSESDVRARAVADFDVRTEKLNVSLATEHHLNTPSLPGAEAGSAAWTVSSSAPTPGLGDAGRSYQGFRAVYAADSGRLLEACWGQMCREPSR